MRLFYGFLLASSALFSQGIEGTVVDSISDLPISGAKVTIEAGGQPVVQAITDDQGAFRISPLKVGSYTVTFSKPEYLPSAPAASSLRFGIGSDSIRLQSRLTPLSRVAGRVIDAGGRAVPGAELLLDGSLTGQTATSDDEGNFLFRAAPGDYLLSARPPSALPPPAAAEDERLAWAHTYYPGVLDRRAAVMLSVHAGLNALGQDVVLAVAHLIRVRGTVFDEKGYPGRNVRVDAARNDETLSQEIHVISNDDGGFEFPSLPEGEWQVSAETAGAGQKLRASAVAQSTGHDLDRLDLHLMPPFAMTGRVTIPRAEGAKLERKPVGVFLHPLIASSERLNQTRTDSEGNFTIKEVYAGRYKIVALSPGPPYFVNSVSIGNRELLGQYVDLVPDAGPVEIKFESEGGGVRGTVEGCASGTVVLAPQESALQDPQFIQTAQCEEQGRFQIANVRPGDYYALAFDRVRTSAELLSSFNPSSVNSQSLFNKAVRVRVERGAFANVDLRIESRNH